MKKMKIKCNKHPVSLNLQKDMAHENLTKMKCERERVNEAKKTKADMPR